MSVQVLNQKTTLPASPPPEYTEEEHHELVNLSPPSSRASLSSLPTYETAVAPTSSSSAGEASSSAAIATAGLHPTHVYQVETAGHPLIALPLAPRPNPISIFSVLPNGEIGPLAYQSVREMRCSGSCVLVGPNDDMAENPLCATMYRFGPGRPPRMQLLGDEIGNEEEFEVLSKAIHTRAQNIRTHLGTFQWRYASKQERKVIGASSLLVLDQITTVALVGGKKTEERRKRVAQLVRSEELRTKGTRGSTAGNGGRLVMDLSPWADAKKDLKQMEVLVVAGCLMMLKKEVDRRRAVQFMVIAGGAGGGP